MKRGEAESPKDGRVQSTTNSKEWNFLSISLQNQLKKRKLLNSIHSSCKSGNYEWYLVTFHVYKKVSLAISKKLSRLSFLTDKLRKYFQPVTRTLGSRASAVIYNLEKDKHGNIVRVADTVDLGRNRLSKPNVLKAKLCFTKETNEDGLIHYHGIIGIPKDDFYKVQSFPSIKNYFIWKLPVDSIDFDYIKYMFKYSKLNLYNDYFF